jgi:hypothetical protein
MTDLAGVPHKFNTDTVRRLPARCVGRIITSELWTSDLLNDSRGGWKGSQVREPTYANSGYMSNVEYILYGQ